MMVSPKISAFPIAGPFFSAPCEKNATVMGIIGNTQGVRIPANPASIDSRKNLRKPFPGFFAGASPDACSDLSETDAAVIVLSGEAAAAPSPLITTENSTSRGGRHCLSSHDIKVTNPLTEAGY